MITAGKCIHYNGTVNPCCEAGVNYAELAGTTENIFSRLPCHTPEYNAARNPRLRPLPIAAEPVECPKRRMPTDEEVKAAREALEKRFQDIGKARAAIVSACGGPWNRGDEGKAGRIDCPACGGKETLRFSRAGLNGHVHAKCATPDCVAWME